MKTNEDKIYSFLGLATRAGKIVSGDDSTLLELKRGNVKLVIVAEDASDNTKKLFKDKSSYRNTALYISQVKSPATVTMERLQSCSRELKM